MKKLVTICAVFSMLLLAGCKKNEPLGVMACGANAEKFTDAAVRFSQDPNEATCEAYKKAIVEYIKSCPTYYTAVQKQELEEFANSPCDFE
ncbi:MAG: hypothetical protein WCY86_03400 [Spirosomataceae bacterium]